MPIDIALLAAAGSHCIGSTVRVDIRLSSSPAMRAHAADILFAWDPAVLRLVGADDAGATVGNILFTIPSGAQGDYAEVNEVVPPADGTGLVWWLCPLNGLPTMIDADIVGSLVFEVVAPFYSTSVAIVPTLQPAAYEARTVVYGSDTPGTPVTGSLAPATVYGCAGDLDGDAFAGPSDLALELANWRAGSGDRLAAILAAWGPCGGT